MKNEDNAKKGNSAFFWGLIIGALIATLLTTKRGRRVLRELSELSLELIENFIEEKAAKEKTKVVVRQDVQKAKEDIESEIAEVEEKVQPTETAEEIEREFEKYEEPQEDVDEEKAVDEKASSETNGHKKRRLFRGIRRR